MSDTREVEQDAPSVQIPTLTLGWRMQMAMAHANRSREYMAARCGVSPSTVSRWLHDGGIRPPRKGDLRIWAQECRVPYSWLDPANDGQHPFELGQPTVAYVTGYLQGVDGGGQRAEPPVTGHLSLVRPAA